MRLRNLIIVWVVLSLAVALYTHTLTPEYYNYPLPFLLDGDEYAIVLPIAVWVVLPLAVFFGIVCVAVLFNKVRRFLFSSRVKHDHIQLIDQIYSQAIGLHENFSFKSPKADEISRVLQRFELKPLPNTIPSGVEKIDVFMNAYKDLTEGEAIDMRQFKIPNDSPLVFLERQNRFKKDTRYAMDVLKRNTETQEIKKHAMLSLLDSPVDVRPYFDKVDIDNELADALLKAMLAKHIPFDASDAQSFLQQTGYDCKAFLQFIQQLKTILTPDVWLSFTERMANVSEEAELAYLFVLADLEMIDRLKDRLKHHTNDEFVAVRAFVELRERGKNYPLQAFFCP